MKQTFSWALVVTVLVWIMNGPVAAGEIPPGFALRWGGPGTNEGKFLFPLGIAADDNGHVYVAEFGGDRIQKFTSQGEYIAQWGSLGSSDGQLNAPSGIGVHPSGEIYVTEMQNFRVSRFSSSGSFLGKWGSQGSAPGQFECANAVTFDNAGNVFVVDCQLNRIQKFTSDGEFILSWGSAGALAGQFNGPQGIVFSNGLLYVVDYGNGRVQSFDTSGTFMAVWGEGYFSGASGIDIDSQGNFYVADYVANRIVKFSKTGEFLVSWGDYGLGDGIFRFPYDVAVDKEDNVYVTDSGNYYVHKFDPRIPPPGPRPPYLAKFLIHIAEVNDFFPCISRITSCQEATTSIALSKKAGPFYAYLLVARGTLLNVGGMQCGLVYDGAAQSGVDILSWGLCGDGEFPTPAGVPPGSPDWPGSGSGNIIAWDRNDNCKGGDIVVAGYFYLEVHSPDTLRIIPRPVDDKLLVGNCSPEIHPLTISDAGFAVFSESGDFMGCNPCFADCAYKVAVRSVTWSAIKLLYK